MNYAFTPDLSLDVYAEPFSATGKYSRFGELKAARSRGLRVYGTDGTTISENTGPAPREITVTDGEDTFSFEREDFKALSFRSNVVLRWEWRPGSTLFLVWQMNRGSEVPVTSPDPVHPGDAALPLSAQIGGAALARAELPGDQGKLLAPHLRRRAWRSAFGTGVPFAGPLPLRP